MQRVAQLAGVSTSTVSRVVNNHPKVAIETATAVRQAMRKLSFQPALRRRVGRPSASSAATPHAIAFLVIGTSGTRTAPAFDRLLRGVSEAVTDNGLSLSFSFVSDPASLPSRILDRGNIDGLLLHGARPGAGVTTPG